MKNVSTEDALLDLTSYLIKNSNKFTSAISIDLKKAFDSINHELLLYKLNKYGFRGNVLNLLSSYLSNRKQYVSNNNNTSNISQINYGVPQGSVLGPVLFLLYINDISRITNECKFVLYADDTNLVFAYNSALQLEIAMNSVLFKLKNWLDLNKLTINSTKTNYIVFNKPKICLNIKLSDEKIIRSESIKFLGIIIDDRLCWKQHYESVKSKLYYSISIMRNLKEYLPTYILKLIYFSLFHSHIIYCTHIWGNTSKYIMQTLIVAQNKIMRQIYRLNYRTNTDYIYKTKKIMSFKNIIIFKSLKIMYKVFNGVIHLNIYNIFTLRIPKYNMRSMNNFNLPEIKTNIGKFHLGYNGPKLWNALSEEDKKV